MIRLLILIALLVRTDAVAKKLGEPIVFRETCDASAVISVTDDVFAVASDEDNILRFYRWSQPGRPIYETDLSSYFATTKKKKSPEMDIEAVAQIGQRTFWITSHGRNSKGEPAPARAKIFALEIKNSNEKISVNPVGNVYLDLIEDLSREPKLTEFRLSEAAKSAPKTKDGLNIEALAATAEGTLLIGFRNPIPKGRALIVPLLNPNEVLKLHKPKFGDPITLDLGGLGLRGMETTRNGYYLIAGPSNGKAESRLFFWKGDNSAPRRVDGVNFSNLNPEGICSIGSVGSAEFLFVSDDGSLEFGGGKECKDLPKSQRQFRAFRFTP